MLSMTRSRSPYVRRTLAAVGAGVLGVSLLGLGGCANDAQGGALLGAGLGAAAGGIIGHQSGEAGEGAAVGAAAGALGGYIIGNESDKKKAQPPKYPY